MATVTAPSREALIEAIATIEAAASVLSELVGPDEPGIYFHELAQCLRVELLGGPTNDEWTPDHPTVVAIGVRSAELEADALERASAPDRIAVLRQRAADYRERGTIDVMFWTGAPGSW